VRNKFAQINGVLETPLFGGSYNLSLLAGYNGFTNSSSIAASP
jgi:hypothetical protein